jgi:hypothetical protein
VLLLMALPLLLLLAPLPRPVVVVLVPVAATLMQAALPAATTTPTAAVAAAVPQRQLAAQSVHLLLPQAAQTQLLPLPLPLPLLLPLPLTAHLLPLLPQQLQQQGDPSAGVAPASRSHSFALTALDCFNAHLGRLHSVLQQQQGVSAPPLAVMVQVQAWMEALKRQAAAAEDELVMQLAALL